MSGSSDSSRASHVEPAALADPVVPVARDVQGEPWGPFSLARIKRGGEIVGWGCSCNRHRNEGDVNVTCQKQFTYGTGAKRRVYTVAEIISKLKYWLLLGYGVDHTNPDARTQHRNINPADLAVLPDRELDEERILLCGE